MTLAELHPGIEPGSLHGGGEPAPAALTAAGDPDPLEAAERAVREAQALVRALRRARR